MSSVSKEENLYQIGVIDSIIRLSISFALGLIIGLERMRGNRPAGLRTHILVCISACLAIIINYEIVEQFSQFTNVDPSRMGSYVISGVGFLGAGTIMREGLTVKGLTTAASLWSCAIVGLACGAGLTIISIVAVIFIIFTLHVVNIIEYKFLANK